MRVNLAFGESDQKVTRQPGELEKHSFHAQKFGQENDGTLKKDKICLNTF
jgi:hypothetical protein